jgi:hypothetical protein
MPILPVAARRLDLRHLPGGGEFTCARTGTRTGEIEVMMAKFNRHLHDNGDQRERETSPSHNAAPTAVGISAHASAS